MLLAQLAEPGQKGTVGRYAAARSHHRLDEHTGNPGTVLGHRRLHRLDVVVAAANVIVRGLDGGGHVAEVEESTVICPIEDQHPVSIGVVASERDGHQVGFGSRVGEPDLLDGRESGAQQLGQTVFTVGHRAERPTLFENPPDGFRDGRRVVAEQPRGVVTEEVDITVTVDIDHRRPIGGGHPEGERIEVEHRAGRSCRQHLGRSLGLGRAQWPLFDVATVRFGHRGIGGVIVQAGDGEIAVFHRSGVREVFAVMGAARVLAREARLGNDFRDIAERAQVQPVMPGQVEGEVAPINAHVHQPIRDPGDAPQSACHACFGADDAHLVPHQILKLLAKGQHQIGLARKGMDGAFKLGGQCVFVGVAQGHGPQVCAHGVARDAAIHGRIRHAVAAQAVRAMGAAGIFARDVEALHRGAGVHVDHNAAHEIMRGWHHFDHAACQIEAAVGAALDHALEFLAHIVGPEMGHRDEDALLFGIIVFSHLGIDAPADQIAGRAFALVVIVEHEPLTGVVDQLTTRAAQAFFQNGAGHPGVIARQKARGVELHHLHVAQRQASAQRHGEAVHGLVARGRVVLVHGWPAAGGHQHALGADEPKTPGAHVDHQNTRQGRAVFRRDQTHGAVFLQLLDARGQHLFHQTVDDFDARQIALVNGAVGGLAREGLLVQRSVGVPVKEAADFVFQLADAHHGLFAKPPGHVLIGQPFAAFDGVHEVAFDRVAAAKGDVIAALHHAGAATFADQAFDGDGDFRAFGRGLLGVESREQARAACTKDQDVGVVALDVGGGHFSIPFGGQEVRMRQARPREGCRACCTS